MNDIVELDGGKRRDAVVVLDSSSAGAFGLKKGLNDLAAANLGGPCAIRAVGKHGAIYSINGSSETILWYGAPQARLFSGADGKAFQKAIGFRQASVSACIKVKGFGLATVDATQSLFDLLRQGGFDTTMVLPLLPLGKHLQVCYGAYLWAGGTETLGAWFKSYPPVGSLPKMLERLASIPELQAIPIAGNDDLEELRRKLLARVWPGCEDASIAPIRFLAPSAFEFLRIANEILLDLQRDDRKRARRIVRNSVSKHMTEYLFDECDEDLFTSNGGSEDGIEKISKYLHRGVNPKSLVDFMLSSGVRSYKKEVKYAFLSSEADRCF